MATVPSNNGGGGGGGGVVLSDSMMELERPGEEKKNRWEANAAAKSACESASESEKFPVSMEVGEMATCCLVGDGGLIGDGGSDFCFVKQI